MMVLTSITNATGAANAAKNAVSPIRQLPQKEGKKKKKKKREQLNINRELLHLALVGDRQLDWDQVTIVPLHQKGLNVEGTNLLLLR